MVLHSTTLVGRSLSYSAALLTYPGVTWLDAVLARFLLTALVTVLVTIVILTGIVLFDGLRPTLDWPSVVLAMVLAALLGLGFGTLNAFLFERFDIWENIWNIFSAPLMIISGVLMLYENLPQIAQEWLWYNPLLHLTGMMREGFYSTYHPQYVSVSLVMVFAPPPLPPVTKRFFSSTYPLAITASTPELRSKKSSPGYAWWIRFPNSSP